MKKTLALVLALALVFSSITVAFAAGTIGAEAQICADLGMLKGETGTVDAAYTATAPTRIQAAVMFLRLKGLEAEALAFTGSANFADADKAAWAKPIMAYLKANPQLGWQGDGTNFNPTNVIAAKEYYKVLLETLGYKQNTAEVVGDFTWDNVVEFAAGKGLSKVAAVTNYTVNDLAIATVEALKANVKEGGKTLVATLVEAGKVDEAKAVAAGLLAEAPTAVAVAVDEVKSLGNAVVQVTYKDDVDAAAAGNAANYAIDGLAINAVVVAGSDTVRLETAAQTAGKIYNLTVGEESVKFTGLAKLANGPEIAGVVSEDFEEVVVTFNRNIDFATGTNVANYAISGVTIVEAEISDTNEVTLTTEGLKNKTNYTVKVINVKSIDGVNRKADSATFKTNLDTAAPRIDQDTSRSKADTNERVIVTFNEKVTKESAENLENYTIKENTTNGNILEIKEVIFKTSGTWKNKRVELVTEPMTKNTNYKLSVNNISDRRKVANVMTKPATLTFKGLAVDKKAPELKDVTVYSKDMLVATFKDDSRIDAASATDVNSYTFLKGSETLDVLSVEKLSSSTGTFKALVTVDPMEVGKQYHLKVVDVVDEFGNGMTKEGKQSFTPNYTDFASAMMKPVTVTGKNTLLLEFTKDLNAASAENIAFYSLNKGIGAPVKAEYEKENTPDCSVTLKFNELKNGEEYKLTVDGIEDLAGNALKLTTGKFPATATAGAWDTDAPELEDAYAVNKYVVALQFSEEVKYETGTELWLTGGTYTAGAPLKLQAKAITDDDTVIEFSDYTSKFTQASVNYKVYRIVYSGFDGAVKDYVGNRLAAIDDEFIFEGSDDAPDAVEVDSCEQVNGGSFDVTMSRNVKFIGGGTSKTIPTLNGKGSFVATIDDNVVTFVGNIKEDVEYEFNLPAYLMDEHGISVANTDTDAHKTVFTGEETDKEKPYIVSVTAIDRVTIEIEFNEDIQAIPATGAFVIKNIDTNKNIGIANIDMDEDMDGNVLTLNLTGTNILEGRYEYELTMNNSKVFDFAGNSSDKDTFTFYGSDLAQHK